VVRVLARTRRRPDRPDLEEVHVTIHACPEPAAADAAPLEFSPPPHAAIAPADPGGTAILALDLGTRCGWALTIGSQILSGTAEFRSGRFEGGGMRYLRFRSFLAELAQRTDGLAAVFFEEVRAHAGTDAAHVYGGLLATLSAWCEAGKVPYRGVPIATIKRHVAGKGNADKQAVMAAVRRLGYAPADDNEADALALLRWALDTGAAGGAR
jgi:hypothetical protein